MDNLEKLYEILVNKYQFTTNELKKIGLTNDNINQMLDENIILREKSGIYNFIGVSKLYEYGNSLVNDDLNKAINIFKICLKLDPENEKYSLKLMTKFNEINDFESAYSYFKRINNLRTKKVKDYNLYLFLYSFLVDLDYEDREYAKMLEFDDVSVIGNSIYTKMENNIRYSVMDAEFNDAFHNFLDKTKLDDFRKHISDLVINDLLRAIIKKRKERSSQVEHYIESKDYFSIYSLYKEEEKKHRLNTYDYFILELVESIIYMKNENKLVEVEDIDTSYISIAKLIYAHQFGMAYENYKQQLMNSDSTATKNLVKLLKKAKEEEERITNELNDKDSNSKKLDILNNLLNHDYDSLYQEIQKHLVEINKSELIPIFSDLIQISKLEDNNSLVGLQQLWLLLGKVFNNEYSISKDLFIKQYSNNISNSNASKLYLDIIKKIDLINGKVNNEDTKEKNIINVDNINFNYFSDKENSTLVKKQPSIKQENEKEIKIDPIKKQKEKLVNYLNEELEKLSEKNPIELLDYMNPDSVKYIRKELEQRDDVKVFSIIVEDRERLVLKKHIKMQLEDETNYQKIVNESRKFFKAHRWKKSIEARNKLICHHETPYSYLYFYNALSYTKKNNKKEALKYYEIANYVAKMEGKNRYSELDDFLYKLKYESKIAQEDKKEVKDIDIKEYEFYDDMNDHYGIDVYEDIVFLVNEEHKSIEDACNEFDLTDEDINIMKLVYARNYYSDKNFVLGDKLFKEVERYKEKTPFIKSLLNEVRTNKKLYPYRNKIKIKEKSN